LGGGCIGTRKIAMCLVSTQVPRRVEETLKLSPTSISLTERVVATLVVGFLRLMIADISLSGEHEETSVSVDNPKKVTPRDKSRRNIHPTRGDARQQNRPDNGHLQECWSPLK
jgi:hypothetical protein